jgi:hypothetical protein
MSLTLTLADQGDGSGILATAAGSDAGQAVTVYAQAVDPAFPAQAWAQAGTRTGNGTVALTLVAGYYFVYAAGVVSAAAALSPVVYGRASNGSEDPHEACVNAVVARLRLLTFNGTAASPGGIPASRIYDYLTGGEQYQGYYPYLSVWPGDERVVPFSDRGERYVLPVELAFFDEVTGSLVEQRRKVLRWRREIEQAFSMQQLPGVSAVFLGTAKPGRLYGPELSGRGRMVSRLALLFDTYLLRGLTSYAAG